MPDEWLSHTLQWLPRMKARWATAQRKLAKFDAGLVLIKNCILCKRSFNVLHQSQVYCKLCGRPGSLTGTKRRLRKDKDSNV